MVSSAVSTWLDGRVLSLQTGDGVGVGVWAKENALLRISATDERHTASSVCVYVCV